MIPPAFLHELLARVDVAEVVGRHVTLKKSGANLAGLCPFHAEKSPSFTVSPSKQFYHCFGCGAHGDAIRFLTEFSGMHFIDAVKELAQEAGLAVPDDELSPADRERAGAERARRETLSDVLEKAAAGYAKRLKESPRAIDYLKRRGLSGGIAKRFGIGYAPEGWNSLASVFPAYDDPLLVESGLVILKDGEPADAGGGPVDAAPAARRYDRFRDRVMFPIRSVRGEVIGFGGRVLDRGEPKYLNSPETPVFVKGRELYGLYESRGAIRERGHALVVEGYMDVVALAQAGIGNAVATLGTACTPEHLQKLFRFTEAVVFSFDGDAAGRRAARRALEASLPHASDTRSVRFLFLPAEHDPDSYVRASGAEAFERCIAEAVPLSRQLIETAADDGDLTTAEGRARFLANARPLWSALPDGALKRQLLGDIAATARDDAALLARQWEGSARAGGGTSPAPARRAPSRPAKSAATLLDRALWLLLRRSDLWPGLDGEAHELLLGQPAPHGTLFAGVERALHEHGPLAESALAGELGAHAAGDPAATAALARIAAFHAPEAEAEGDLAEQLGLAIRRLRLHAVDDELRWLFESGVESPDAARRSRELLEARRLLKG